MTGIEIKTLLAAVLVALGVAVPMPDFFGGMFVGLGACYLVMIWREPESRGSLLATLLTGFFSALAAAIFHTTELSQGLWIWRDLPLQLQMGAAGALSRPAVEAMPAIGKSLMAKVRLPGGGE